MFDTCSVTGQMTQLPGSSLPASELLTLKFRHMFCVLWELQRGRVCLIALEVGGFSQHLPPTSCVAKHKALTLSSLFFSYKIDTKIYVLSTHKVL